MTGTAKPPTKLKLVVDPEFAELGLILNKDGQPEASLPNTISVLSRHRQWLGVIAYDEFAQEVVTLIAPPVRPHDRPEVHQAGDWSDEDSARTVSWIAGELGFSPRIEYVEQAVRVVARKRMFHPVREYLDGLTWDRVPRLDTWLATYFGAEQSEYAKAVGAKWLISAVARVLEPGCKVDCLLVLEGLQGAGKSSGLAALAGAEWFADAALDIGNKDSYQNLRRKWIYEMGELASLKGVKVERTKAFITAQSDYYRPSFGRRSKDFPRQVVFAGTTNKSTYLADETGARRFWPVKCTAVDVVGIRRDRGQLWAEATARYRLKEAWHVDTAELRALCEDQQEERQVDEPLAGLLVQWLKEPRIKRQNDSTITLYPDEGLLPVEILMGCFERQLKDIKPGDQTAQALGHMMKQQGWERLRRLAARDSARRWAYFPPGTDECRRAVPVLGVLGSEVTPDTE